MARGISSNTLMQKASPDVAQQVDLSSDSLLLDELTQVYSQERYGEKHASLPHAAQLSAWMPDFVKRLKR